ncbi:MAG: secretion protein F [Dorea sp.]|jgi:tight adherence protein C|nr:secretion protein F [Dorea sp.]
MEMGRIIMLILATVMVLAWIILATRYEKMYAGMVRSIDPKEYKYPELFCVGFALMKFLKIDSKSKRARKRIKEIAEVQGKRYAEYYFYVINAAKWTYGFTVLVLLVILGALANSSAAVLMGVILPALLMWYVEEAMNDKLEARRDELLADMPQMLSKLTLLVNSGMVVREAWKKVAYGGEREIYIEMQMTVQEMQNGISELEAYRNFAERCSIKQIRRFASTMIQNMQKGNAEISYFLREMSDEMWEEKKHLVKRKGEAANSKLVLPTTMIFMGILIMIMLPAFLGMKL